jgi:hypothetical protein
VKLKDLEEQKTKIELLFAEGNVIDTIEKR